MRALGLVLLLLPCVSCGSTKAKLDEALQNTAVLAQDVQKTSAKLREDTLPAVQDTLKGTKEATEQMREIGLELQRIFVNFEPKLEIIKQKVVDALTTWTAVGKDVRDLKAQVEVEINKASDMQDRLADHGRLLDMGLWVGIALGGILIILLIVIIHHKLTSRTRHQRQMDFMLQNGGVEKILRALEPQLHAKFVEEDSPQSEGHG